MPKTDASFREYLVTMRVTGVQLVYVRARDKNEAKEKARRWEVEEETPIDDIRDWEVVSVEENT